MDLIKIAQQAQEEIESEKKELETATGKVIAREKAVKEKELILQNAVEELTKIREDLESREEAVKKIEDIQGLEKKTLEDIHALATEKSALRKKEQELLLIQETQKVKEEELTKREFAVSEREENYREQLKKEFTEMIQKKFA